MFGFVNADVNGARKILKKFKKSFYDYITGLKQTIKVRVFGKLKSSSKYSKMYEQTEVARCDDHLSGIRLVCFKQTPCEALVFSQG